MDLSKPNLSPNDDHKMAKGPFLVYICQGTVSQVFK